LIIIWIWAGEGLAKTFDAVNNVLTAPKNWWLRPDLNRGPHHYE
jgi:hypothetical protein